MGYDPASNEFKRLETAEEIKRFKRDTPQFLFSVGEQVIIKGVVFIIHDIGENRLVLKPVKQS